MTAPHQFSHAEMGSMVRVAEGLMATMGELRAELAAVKAERDATEAALRKWCARLHAEWFEWEGIDYDTRRELANDISNLKAAGLWREPTGGES